MDFPFKLLEKLKGLVTLDIKNSFNINIANKEDINTIKKSGRTISDDSSTEPKYLYVVDLEVLHIIIENLHSEERKRLDALLHEFIADDGKLLEEKTVNTLNELEEYYKDPGEDNKIKKFFKDIIPLQDLEALEASLFLRREFAKRKPVSDLKFDIIQRFGDRGKNISNLCTARYFEEFLAPLYNQDKEEFKKIYELAVTGHLVVFVNEHMNETAIGLEIESKMGACKRYGVGFLHIHGIGQMNVSRIKKYIKLRSKFFNAFLKNIYESKNKDIIVVELLLND